MSTGSSTSSPSVMGRWRSVTAFLVLLLALASLTRYYFNAGSNPSTPISSLNTAPDVSLSSDQKTLVTSVLELFAGHASLDKLQKWADDAVFEDPITVARGREQYEPQWYGLQTAFSKITPLSHTVTSSGNPITMDMKTSYVVKGINKEQTISSVIKIFTKPDGKIEKVEDRWDDKLPDGAVQNAFRRLNAVSVPKMVGVPKDKEEDAQKQVPEH